MFSFILNSLQTVDANTDIISSIIKVSIFLITIGLGGYMFIRFQKYGFYNNTCNNKLNPNNKISILDSKMLGGGKYISVIEYNNKKVMVSIDKENIRLICEIENTDNTN